MSPLVGSIPRSNHSGLFRLSLCAVRDKACQRHVRTRPRSALQLGSLTSLLNTRAKCSRFEFQLWKTEGVEAACCALWVLLRCHRKLLKVVSGRADSLRSRDTFRIISTVTVSSSKAKLPSLLYTDKFRVSLIGFPSQPSLEMPGNP